MRRKQYRVQRTEKQHAEKQHAKEQHAKKRHTEKQHAKTENQHAENQHAENQHAEKQHAEKQHAKEQHAKKQYTKRRIQHMLAKRKIKLWELDKVLGHEKAAEARRDFIEKTSKTGLSSIASTIIKAKDAKPNIELMIGAAQVPLGIAGPVPVKGDFAKGEFYLPLATTEGALVASVNRGCSIIRKCGGANVYVQRSGQTRSILFETKSITTARAVVRWTDAHFAKLKEVAESTSRYLELKKVEPIVAGSNLWLRVEADTKDAMGMNMITFACERIGEFLEKQFSDLSFISASGNLCTDKKPSVINLVKGRGKTVLAETFIPNRLIRKYLKTTAKQVIELNYRKNILGSMISGSFGFNAQFANIIAAMYLATGQDLGHVVEGSQGYTTMDMVDDSLHVSVTLPSVQVGTVGGGTGLPTQKECLRLLGVNGTASSSPGTSGRTGKPGDHAYKLAEIVGVAVLAGELSLIGALAARHLGKAHRALNR